MRLFTAIDLSEEVRANIESVQAVLKPTAQIQWSSAANLHITTKFIGAWPEERLADMQAALRAISAPAEIDISLGEVGWFTKAGSPHSLWVGIQAPPALHFLAKATDAAVHALGVQLEKRPYTPHLTLARIRNHEPLHALRQAVAAMEPLKFGTFTASRYHLYLSESSTSGSIYTKLADFSFIP